MNDHYGCPEFMHMVSGLRLTVLIAVKKLVSFLKLIMWLDWHMSDVVSMLPKVSPLLRFFVSISPKMQ